MSTRLVVRDGWVEDQLQPRTDTLHADMLATSQVLLASKPWLYRIGDIVRLPNGEMVQVLDGFLHIRRGVSSRSPYRCYAGETVLIIASASAEGDWL